MGRHPAGEPGEATDPAIVPWDLSCKDWKERLRTGRSLVPRLPLFQEDAERAVRAFNKLRLFDVPGTPTLAEAGGDWFRDIVRALFGSYSRELKHRFIRELFLMVPKKQNKTTGGALVMLTALLLNERPHAPMLFTGPVQKTADDAFAAAEGAIRLDNVINKKLQVQDTRKTITHRETRAKLEILTFDPDIVAGKKVVAGLVDEEHVLGKMARAKKAMVQLRGGLVPFPEAFLAIITTQSDEPPAGVFAEDLERARAVRDGKRKRSRLLAVLYEFPEEIQKDPEQPWRNPKLWPMVTPNLGLSIDMPTLEEAFTTEEENGEAALRIWASQHLNVQIGVALTFNAWKGAELWEAAKAPVRLALADVLALSEVVAVGIDGGGLDDLLGLAAMGRGRQGTRWSGRWLLWTHAWVHPVALKRRESEITHYEGFKADGDLDIIEQLPEDVSAVVAVVLEIQASGLLCGIGMDPEVTHKVMLEALTKAGIPLEICHGVPQGWRLVGPMTIAERKLLSGELLHGGQRLMAYAVANAKEEPRGNAKLITKQASGRAKIDPLMATLNAVALMALNPAAATSMGDWLRNPARKKA